MNWILFFESHFSILMIFVFIIGAIVGSFLNVVIYRYPIMLKAAWENECVEFLNENRQTRKSDINLFFPRSYCPHCQMTVPMWLNIPILSYLFLRGKCANCHERIALHYPIVELLTALLSMVVVAHFGLTWITLAIWIFTCCLIVLSVIDLQHQLLPDILTLSMLWLGLISSTKIGFISPVSAIQGAVIGYLFLWVIAQLYQLLRKKEGIGYGDCKMLAMFGAWVGTAALFNIVLLASVLALITNVYWLIRRKITMDQPVPFGPYLALSGWVTLIYGPVLLNWLVK